MKVHIVGSSGACAYAAMYYNDGWELSPSYEDADLVQFTGGEDVSPELYGCGKHPTSTCNRARDDREEQVFQYCIDHDIPMVGICRGGQFLNVMCGGRMYQNVNNHAIPGTHETTDMGTGRKFETTSTHHQMMIPDNKSAVILGGVSPSMCDFKDYVDSEGTIYTVEPKEDDIDVEVVYYPYQHVLCFQPHPEYDTGEPCREWFFSLVMAKLFNDHTRYENLIYGEAKPKAKNPFADIFGEPEPVFDEWPEDEEDDDDIEEVQN